MFYKFTLKMFDVQEGTIEWQDERNPQNQQEVTEHTMQRRTTLHGPGRGRHHHADLGQQRPWRKRGPKIAVTIWHAGSACRNTSWLVPTSAAPR